VISYELGARARESIPGPSKQVLGEKGWTIDFRGGLNVPPALGKLMGLSEDQIANAIGICASQSLPLGILDTDREENTMTKNLRFGFIVYNAILSCMLAQKGFTGPVRVVEGESGLRHAVLHGEMDLERMTDFSGWRILKTRHKILCVNGGTQAYVLATLAIVKENDLRPEDISAVLIRAPLSECQHTTTPAKKYPRNAESADHSAFYTNAIAIKERNFGPESFEPEKFTDPVVLDLIEKITVEPDLNMHGHSGVSEIITRDGRRFKKRIDSPHGFGDDPLNDAELEDKFRQLAARYMGEEQIRNIIDTVWNAEKLEDISTLTKMMVFQQR
jgi:2-methylcitrate dehydratase